MLNGIHGSIWSSSASVPLFTCQRASKPIPVSVPTAAPADRSRSTLITPVHPTLRQADNPLPAGGNAIAGVSPPHPPRSLKRRSAAEIGTAPPHLLFFAGAGGAPPPPPVLPPPPRPPPSSPPPPIPPSVGEDRASRAPVTTATPGRGAARAEAIVVIRQGGPIDRSVSLVARLPGGEEWGRGKGWGDLRGGGKRRWWGLPPPPATTQPCGGAAPAFSAERRLSDLGVRG